ncbi:hypothetical protein BVY03_03550 [bacterium K02(2017)]|nr:hypothetical protein BVY03_03550 [bacterium K02(2017)]
MFLKKTYLNSAGGGKSLNLTHDVKRVLADSRMVHGHVNIISTQATAGVSLMENDLNLQQEFINSIKSQYDESNADSPARRSRTGADCYHHMAGLVGLSLVLPFENGQLVSSPFHDIVALDFEPVSGRREFIISVLGVAPQENQQGQ